MPAAAVQQPNVLTTLAAAVQAMHTAPREQKEIANKLLTEFQRTKEAWITCLGILESDAAPELKYFAATTIKGKMTLDIRAQLQPSELPAIREKLLLLIKRYSVGPKHTRTQLVLSLAILAIYMTAWKDVIEVVVTALGDDPSSSACILDFLRYLAEELLEGRKITLSDDDLAQRTGELLTDNADKVVQLLVSYARASPQNAKNPQLMECITAWLREIPVDAIVASPLLDAIFAGLDDDSSFKEAAECLCAITKETRDVDASYDAVKVLLPRILTLRPKIREFAEAEDVESFQSLTRIFSDAGEAWVVAIARDPPLFRPVVEAILECAARDKERDVIEYTFNFWYELKQYLTLDKYVESRAELFDVYSKLVDVLLNLLEYPTTDDPNQLDLFDGNRTAEDKFREFRHVMGDTLKDACHVLGVGECLSKILAAIKLWLQKYGSTATPASVPHWQQLEAPIFALRAAGREVDRTENTVLPQLIPLLVSIPAHEKLRYATVMTLGRYTEWTASHPEYLQPQFRYILSSFALDSAEIADAAAMSVKYFCQDCKNLLSDEVLALQGFYNDTLDKLSGPSQMELTEGVTMVIAVQPPAKIYDLLKIYCDPLVERVKAAANLAVDEKGKLDLCDKIQLLITFMEFVTPYIKEGENPAVKYWTEVFPILSKILGTFIDSITVCEKICKAWRVMVLSFRTDITPLLPSVADHLLQGFSYSKQGCFLWATCPIMREFSEGRENVPKEIVESVWSFFDRLTREVLRVMSGIPPADQPDFVEDFFRLLDDALSYHPARFLSSDLLPPLLDAAATSLTLVQRDPLIATLHYLRDLIAFGGENPPISADTYNGAEVAELRRIVTALLAAQGADVVKRVLAGMMITFPPDCFADGSGVLLGILRLLPEQGMVWIGETVKLLPQGSVTPAEAERLMAKIRSGRDIPGDARMRQVRVILQDFTNSYRRRNVAPREGLGALEGGSFHFSG